MYFNTAYFGEGAFGIEEAAQTYFQVPAKDLTLAQSALLSGLLTQPSLLSPLSYDPQAAFTRQRIVLQNMAEQGHITLKQKEVALKEPLTFNPSPPARSYAAPHFALYIRDQLIKEFGEPYVIRSGLRVTTTLDLDIQAQAEQAIATQVAALKKRGAGNGAAIVIDPITHQILAMVGSKGWYEETWGKANMATSPRQTGSAFKPLVYATAFEQGLITPATVLLDVPTTFGTDYRPQDYDGKSRGPVTVRRALANSLNVPAVATMQKVGVKAVAEFAKALSVTSLSEANDYNLALALGAGEISLLELTNSYATFAADGLHLPAQAILSVTNKQDKTLDAFAAVAEQKISPGTAFLISSILSDNSARAEIFGRSLTISRPAAVKTGTSQNYRDAWTVGYTPQLAVGIWIGNNDNTPMQALAGALGAAPAWKNIMEANLKNQPVIAFEPPNTIEQITLCRRLNPSPTPEQTAPPSFTTYKEYFLAGTAPKNRCASAPRMPNPEIVRTISGPISNGVTTLH
ncbi:MAG: penicillin-binding protein [Candidatus Andersenbacteria bacterium]|nr:penicillin-binding protein [Candidatus Andersenbacteria bacterium]